MQEMGERKREREKKVREINGEKQQEVQEDIRRAECQSQETRREIG